MKEELPDAHSGLISAVLAGSWRNSPFPPLRISESQLDEVTPLLYGSGAGALGWWRVRASELGTTASAAVLQQAYRLQSLQAEIHEEKIQRVFLILRQASIEPLLVKGWAAASLYPEKGLRPYGDIDLLVKPEDYNKAAGLLALPQVKDCWVDLRQDCTDLAGQSLAQLFHRSVLMSLGDSTVRVLSAEDHLALLAVHLLRHGAWRPLWLCDIGAIIERLPANFNWEICLGPNEIRANWIKCAIGLAGYFLQATTDNLPDTVKACRLPSWLVEAVRKEWQQPFAINQPPMSHPIPISTQLRSAAGIIEALRQRWPNPILATVSINGAFNGVPRFPYQLGNCILRALRLLLRLPANG